MSKGVASRCLVVAIAFVGGGLLASGAAWVVGIGSATAVVSGGGLLAAAACRLVGRRKASSPKDGMDGDGPWESRFWRVGTWRLDPASRRVELSAEHLHAAGLDASTARDMTFSDYLGAFVHPEDRALLETWILAEGDASRDAPAEIGYRTLCPDGGVRHLRAARRDAPGGTRTVATQDVSERRRLEERLLRGALYDSLTGLPNRLLFDDRLSDAIGRPGSEYVGVALMDLDRFLAVNASLGREAGDGMLLGLAVRLVGSLPPGTTVARVGEDEFAALLEVPDIASGERIAETMRLALASPLARGERAVSLTASVGLALARREGCSADALLQKAETALFQARNRGGDSVALFDEGQGKRDREEVSLGLELRQAAISDELELHFQPVVALADLSTLGFEALVRWRRPGVGLVPPGLFIPVAERNGAIADIGLWVLHRGLDTLAGWLGRGWDVTMAINLSPRQIEQEEVVEQVRQALALHRVPPERVKLEITESAFSASAAETAERVARIRAMGVRISLDDFGTGYSSLGHLHRFPVDTLKIDKSFVDMVRADAELSPVPRAVVGLAHSLGKDVVAEGIESPHQLARLREMGCEMGQGYLFSRPLPVGEAEEWLRGRGGAAAA